MKTQTNTDKIFVDTLFKKFIIKNDISNTDELYKQIEKQTKLDRNDFYLLYNGKLIKSNDEITNGMHVEVRLRLVGGKGGFGSMLRAIGAQIEKTTNREACRDLSGRRLRDINEEKRLKNWIASQAEREREAEERKKKKLERLCVEPKHKFEDSEYEKLRSQLPEMVNDAVEQGFQQASTSSAGLKRKSTDKKVTKNKKTKLWVDADLSLSEDSELDDDNDSVSETKNPIPNSLKDTLPNVNPVIECQASVS